MRSLVVTFVMIASGIFVLNSAAWAQDDPGQIWNFSHHARHVMALMAKVRARLVLSLRFYLRI
jgi:hypothetical protein